MPTLVDGPADSKALQFHRCIAGLSVGERAGAALDQELSVAGGLDQGVAEPVQVRSVRNDRCRQRRVK